jgi:hypothetical protein
MGMKAYKQAVAVTGSYTDRQGNEKKRYTNVGTLFQYDDGGFALKLDSVPVGDGWNGFISFFDIKPRDGAGGNGDADTSRGSGREQPSRREDFSADLDDSIPFATSLSVW